MKQITIKDIARELGISVSTVSRALKDNPEISKATKEIVRESARRLNYKPNLMASNLRTNKNTTLGVIIPEVNHHFFASVLDGIEQAANEAGYSILICQSHENMEKEIQNVQTLLHSRVAGMLVGVSKETMHLHHLQEVLNSNTPLVLFDRPCPSLQCDQVVSDDYAGAYSAVEHLIQTGCKRILYFSSSMNLEVAHRRYQGWRNALQKHGLWHSTDDIIIADTRELAIEELPKQMNADQRPDAIFCVNDHCASGVLYAAQKLGLRVPKDLSICGFSDAPLARITTPMLTTVEQHGTEIGTHAMQALLRKLNGDTHTPHTEIVRTNLVVRGTTR